MGKKHKKHHKSEKKSDNSVDTKPKTKEEKLEKHESIKLVLKVGGTDTPSQHHESSSSSHKHKHKKKKKKKSSDKEKHKHERDRHEKKEKKDKKREREVVEEESNQEPPIEPPAKRPAFEDEINLQRRLREPRNLLEGEEVTSLQSCLNYLQKMLQRKDTKGFFAFPVNDVIAPGYSSIIMHPMDFSTMKEKVDADDYINVTEYKRDFKLMCENAMVYNHPETVYYKEAQRLMQSGLKAMSKEKLSYMRKSLGFMASLTSEELGLDQDEPQVVVDVVHAVDVPQVKLPKPKPKPKPSSCRFEAFADNLTPEEILEQARAAAKDAADSLTMRQPHSKMGFLRRSKDGSTSLNILNPDNNGIVSETERVITIGGLTGKLASGTGSISGFKEDKRNKANPYLYLNYGQFSSYAPSYDSSFSNLTKDESDLLLSTYGDETGVQYAKSIRDFVAGCGDYVSKMADSLLDVLTGGEHGKTMKVFHEKKAREDEERKKQEMELLQALQGTPAEITSSVENKENKRNDPNLDFNSLRSLSELGIDTTFLDSYEKQESTEQQEVQIKLDAASQLLSDLQKSQHDRLSQKPPAHLANIPGPSDREMELADNVTKQLTELAKKVKPGDLSSVKAIRSALGMTVGPIEGSTEENEDTHSQVLTQMSGDEPPPDIDRDLQDFLDQGPVLRVCESPTIGKDGTPVS